MIRYTLVSLLLVLSAIATQGQTGPCSEDAIKEGHATLAKDAFTYMPPYGKPVIGKPAMEDANRQRFSDRTNIKSTWVGEHKIVAAPSGEMGYERGIMQVGYDSKKDGQHHEFKAVILKVY